MGFNRVEHCDVANVAWQTERVVTCERGTWGRWWTGVAVAMSVAVTWRLSSSSLLVVRMSSNRHGELARSSGVVVSSAFTSERQLPGGQTNRAVCRCLVHCRSY